MTQYGYTFLGLTALVAVLVAVIVFALLRFASAARDTRRHLGQGGSGDSTLLAVALQDAVSKLKAQEQAMSARAEASEELSGQIVESLTAGLLLVDGSGRVEILNPAGRRMLGLGGQPVGTDYRTLLADMPALVDALTECLDTAQPIVRRTLQVTSGRRSSHLGVTVSPLGGGAGPGGAICLFSDLTAVRPSVSITGSVDPEHRVCRVAVADNGPGIPEASRDRIFQPFFTTRSRGTGLGLAIVQKVVVMHNGRVAVLDNSDPGAVIQLTFPLADA